MDFVRFLIERQQPIDPESEEFTSELVAAFAEARVRALEHLGNTALMLEVRDGQGTRN
jgi:hypothetical protein